MSSCFAFFTLITIIGQIIIYKYILDTANKNETEIDKMFETFNN